MVSQNEGRGVVPDWVDEKAAQIASKYTVVRGPAGIVLLGGYGKDMGWVNARDAQLDLGISAQERAPHMAAFYTRLRALARLSAESAKLHPLTAAGGVKKQGREWVHFGDDNTSSVIGAEADVAVLNMTDAFEHAKMLSLNPASGGWGWRLLGSLTDAHALYPIMHDPLKCVVVCGRGVEREAVVVVEKGGDPVVIGLRISRSMDTSKAVQYGLPQFSLLCQRYFALWHSAKQKTALRILRMPDEVR